MKRIKGFIWKDYRKGEYTKESQQKSWYLNVEVLKKGYGYRLWFFTVLQILKNTKELYTVSECLAQKANWWALMTWVEQGGLWNGCETRKKM